MQVRSDANFREDINQILTENQLGEGQFNGEQVFPVMNVSAQDGRFHKLKFEEVKDVAVDDTGDGRSAANEVTHELDKDTWATELHNLKELITNRDAARFDDLFDAEVSSADLLRYYIRKNREKRIADIVLDTASVFSAFNTAATTVWATAATATPVDDVGKAKEKLIRQLNGMVARGRGRLIGVGNSTSRTKLVATADIKDRWTQGNTKSEGMADLSDEQIASSLGLDAVFFSALAFGATDIWDATKFGVYWTSDDPMFKNVPRVGNILLWQDFIPEDLRVRTWEENDPWGEWVLVETDTDEKLITARAGHIITGV